jgi:hypothetical protein
MGTTLTEAMLESGADVVCLDVMSSPKQEEWGRQPLHT